MSYYFYSYPSHYKYIKPKEALMIQVNQKFYKYFNKNEIGFETVEGVAKINFFCLNTVSNFIILVEIIS